MNTQTHSSKDKARQDQRQTGHEVSTSHPTSSDRATQTAKTGEPLRAEQPKDRSPKQENL